MEFKFEVYGFTIVLKSYTDHAPLHVMRSDVFQVKEDCVLLIVGSSGIHVLHVKAQAGADHPKDKYHSDHG